MPGLGNIFRKTVSMRHCFYKIIKGLSEVFPEFQAPRRSVVPAVLAWPANWHHARERN
jgi:hypothetical protein